MKAHEDTSACVLMAAERHAPAEASWCEGTHAQPPKPFFFSRRSVVAANGAHARTHTPRSRLSVRAARLVGKCQPGESRGDTPTRRDGARRCHPLMTPPDLPVCSRLCVRWAQCRGCTGLKVTTLRPFLKIFICIFSPEPSGSVLHHYLPTKN